MNSLNKTPGELAIIKFIRQKFPKKRKEIFKGIGDDALVFRNGYVVSVDSFYEHVHFDLQYFSLSALGYHCMAASLSDLAAMAASPICALVSLGLTKSMTTRDTDELYRGFEQLSKKYAMDIAGGDIVTSPVLGISITVIGYTKKSLMRSGARPGQALYSTNFLGLAEVGRNILQQHLPKNEYPDAVNKHLFPEPRIFEARSLKKFATSCIDTSDGLSTDAHHLTEESRVKITIDAEHVPIHPEVGRYCSMKNIDPLQFILAAGEDFELLFTAYELPKIKRTQLFKIGRITKGRGLYLSLMGKTKPIQPSGYEHLI
jgi:thiamine-monophosphate kinase